MTDTAEAKKPTNPVTIDYKCPECGNEVSVTLNGPKTAAREAQTGRSCEKCAGKVLEDGSSKTVFMVDKNADTKAELADVGDE
jgi:DNA-directed RNA polymerase subunit RPC12/RpoP